jgi:hypothetical protein
MPRRQRAVARHLFEGFLLPGTFLALTGQIRVAVALVALSAPVVAVGPRPVPWPEPSRDALDRLGEVRP